MEDGGAETVVIDLSALSFLDSTGLRTIVTADQRARKTGRRLAIVKGPETVHRVFTITRLDERLDMVDGRPAMSDLESIRLVLSMAAESDNF